jgi:hypothetical protein
MSNIIQAYFFNKIKFNNEEEVIKYLVENNLPTNQKISNHKYYYKIKLLSEKKLKLDGYNIIKKQLEENILINTAYKQVILNNIVSF